MVTATSAEAERAGQLRITGILLLVLIEIPPPGWR